MSGVLHTAHGSGAGLVVVGAGVAGLRTIQSVRHEGYEGRITLVGQEPHLPYDRPPLSKEVLQSTIAVEATDYHPSAYFAGLGVDLVLGRSGARLDARRARLTLDDGTRLGYDALVIATGARPRRLPFGTAYAGVHVLRTKEDATRLRMAMARSQHLIVVGAGFIGAEVASTAVAMGLQATVVETSSTPLVRAVGERVGQHLAGLHDAGGVRLVYGRAVTGILGTDCVQGLALDDGSRLEADLVLLGVGIVPDVEWLTTSDLLVRDGLACDGQLNAGDPRVFGAGDAISWPNPTFGRRVRSQQWTTAADQGRHVGRVLMRGPEAGLFANDMYFWSDQYGVRIQGAGPSTDDVVLLRRDARGSLVAAYRDQGRVTGVVTVNAPRDFVRLRKLAARRAPWSEVAQTAEAEIAAFAQGGSQ